MLWHVRLVGFLGLGTAELLGTWLPQELSNVSAAMSVIQGLFRWRKAGLFASIGSHGLVSFSAAFEMPVD
jgi:hypothetical protein